MGSPHKNVPSMEISIFLALGVTLVPMFRPGESPNVSLETAAKLRDQTSLTVAASMAVVLPSCPGLLEFFLGIYVCALADIGMSPKKGSWSESATKRFESATMSRQLKSAESATKTGLTRQPKALSRQPKAVSRQLKRAESATKKR